MISLDLETTGIDAENEKIIEIGAVKFKEGKVLDTFKTFINPQRSIPSIVTHITGITDEDVKDAPTFGEVHEKLKEFIGKEVIVGHNIQFDMNFLKSEGLELKIKQYDTYLLSLLLLNSPSYSLETLTKNLGIKHQDKHRALDDAVACMELFSILTKKIDEIPIHTLEEMKILISKSDLHIKNLFIRAKGSNESRENNNKSIPEKKSQVINLELTEKILDAFETEKNLLIDAGIGTKRKKSILSAAAIQAKKNHERIVISVNSDDSANELNELSDVQTQILEFHSNYLSTKRLNDFKQREHFEDPEITLLIKILLGKSHYDLSREERMIFKREISCDLKECDHSDPETKAGCAFAEAQESAIDSDIIIVKHHFLLGKSEELIPPYRYLIIDEADYLEKAGTQVQTFFQEVLEQKYPDKNTDILMGLIGIFFEKYNDPNEYQLKLSEYHHRVIDWQKICQTAAKISEELTEIFSEEFTDNQVTWIFKNKDGSVCLKSARLDAEKKLKELISEKKSVILSSPTLQIGGSFNYIRAELGLHEDFDEVIEPSTLPEELKPELIAPREFPMPNTEDYFNKCTDYILKAEGRTFVTFTSGAAIEAMYKHTAPLLKEKGIKVLAHRLTGGFGKIMDTFESNPKNCVIFGNLDFWENLKIEGINNFIITKLPFDPPSEPVFSGKCQKFTNSFDEYSVPRALLRLEQAKYKLIKSNKGKTSIVLLDTRVHTKKYGRLFIQALQYS